MSIYQDGFSTKKEIIIKTAREEPFLTIEEIADRAHASPSYVKSALSEAGISLHELRRNLYEDLKARLNEINQLSGT